MMQFLGFVLASIGALIAALSGLCTIFSLLLFGTNSRDFASVLVIGGGLTAIGMGLCWVGVRLAENGEVSLDPSGRKEDP